MEIDQPKIVDSDTFRNYMISYLDRHRAMARDCILDQPSHELARAMFAMTALPLGESIAHLDAEQVEFLKLCCAIGFGELLLQKVERELEEEAGEEAGEETGEEAG